MIFEGHIRTLGQPPQPDGWLRREIIVKQDPETAYPKFGDKWTLIDLDGCNYVLQFIKGAHVSGYSLLGQPGKLKAWFIKRYPREYVVKDYVFFEKCGANKFRLFTSKEWLSEHGLICWLQP